MDYILSELDVSEHGRRASAYVLTLSLSLLIRTRRSTTRSFVHTGSNPLAFKGMETIGTVLRRR